MSKKEKNEDIEMVPVKLTDLLGVIENAKKEGRLEDVIKGFRSVSKASPDVAISFPKPVWTSFLEVFQFVSLCAGGTFAVTGTATQASTGVPSITGGTLTIQFNLTSSNPAKCSVSATAVSITNTIRGGPAVAVPAANLVLGGGFYVAKAAVPGTWAAGDALSITVTMRTSNRNFCDTCTIAPATSTYTTVII